MNKLLSNDLGNIVIPAVIGGISNTRGKDFFNAITRQLAIALSADYTFIGRIDEQQQKSNTIAICHKDTLIDNFEYDLKDTPCEQVATDGICVHEKDVCQLYPHDELLIDMGIEGYLGTALYSSDGDIIGLIVALYEKPIPDAERVTSIFQLFAGRVAAEIENTEKNQTLETLNATLQENNAKLNEHRQLLERRVKERTKELEQEKFVAEQADSAKSLFLATMSHEIRTPMNGLLGMAELLDNSDLTFQQQIYVNSMRQSGNTLMTLVNDILDHSKIESGEIELEQKSFNINDWLFTVAEPFHMSVKEHVTLNINIDPSLTKFVSGDVNRLQQILGNLLGNAAKFTENGSIELKAESLGNTPDLCRVKFSVIDTGIGISNNQKERIFSPFTQAKVSTTRMYGGTGLGLSISKNLIAMMGGELELDSTIDQGSSFFFTLSFATSKNPTSIKPDREIDHQYRNLRVLLVDDNSTNQLVAKGQLSKLGLSPTVLDDGAEAVNVICERKERFDIIFMDCEMPIMDGYEATRRIRRWEQNNKLAPTPIYALTAHAFKENTIKCIDAGMNGKLTKPIKIDDYFPVLNSLKNNFIENTRSAAS
ncbi:MAG: ATP-binding protein [Oceanicoccus sp.]